MTLMMLTRLQVNAQEGRLVLVAKSQIGERLIGKTNSLAKWSPLGDAENLGFHIPGSSCCAASRCFLRVGSI